MASVGAVRYATSRDETRIAWLEQGEGPPILFSSAWMTTLDSHFVLERLGQRQLGRMICQDHRGFGKSDWHVPHSIEAYADDLEAVADAARVGKFSILSMSTGCFAALELAARSERVERVLLVEPMLTGEHIVFGADWHSLPAFVETNFPLFWRMAMQAAFGWGGGGPWLEEAIARTAESANAVDTLAYLETLRGVDLATVAPRVEAFCLIVHNQRDEMSSGRGVSALARLLPHCRLVEGSGARFDWLGSDPGGARNFFAVARDGRAPAAHATDSDLTARELEVLRLIATGATNRQIADALVITEATAARHVHNILGKLGFSNRSEAAAWAARTSR